MLKPILDAYPVGQKPLDNTTDQINLVASNKVREDAGMLRFDYRFDDNNTMLGLAYGYSGKSGQWWHEQVRRGIAEHQGPGSAEVWLGNYFELTEVHVRPDSQGRGIGEELLRRLLSGVRADKVLLSTPEGPSRAWSLYGRLGFVDVLRHYRFTGDPRPFGVLGRALPLD